MFGAPERRPTRRYADPARPPAPRAPRAAAPLPGTPRRRRPCREMRVDPALLARLEAHYRTPERERPTPRGLWKRLVGRS